MLTCKICRKQYVGQTVDIFRSRLNNYKSNDKHTFPPTLLFQSPRLLIFPVQIINNMNLLHVSLRLSLNKLNEDFILSHCDVQSKIHSFVGGNSFSDKGMASRSS